MRKKIFSMKMIIRIIPVAEIAPPFHRKNEVDNAISTNHKQPKKK